MVIGAYAISAHGCPRATGDIDLWVRTEPANAQRVYAALARFGAPLKNMSVEDFATMGMIYQIGLPPVRIDVLTEISGVTFDEAWPNRVEAEIEGLRVNVIGRDDLIANKKASGRPKDAIDVAMLEKQIRKG